MLLEAGIEVWTTMNVQHMESLYDQIWQVTGIQVRETVPDWVVRRAAETQVPLFLLIRDSYENWGFPKGHVEAGERSIAAARREVEEETGLRDLDVRAPIDTIDWYFRFRGRLIHKICDFYLMELEPGASGDTIPQRGEGITACVWASYDEAAQRISYENARRVLTRAHAMVSEPRA